jgi:O-antigen/teichoic acid export membrane protein
VNRLRAGLRRWREDPLLRRVVKNSSYLSSSNTLAAGLSFVQGILIARLLGLDGLGEVTAIIAFVTAVNVLLSFRMSEVVVRHVNQARAASPPSLSTPLPAGDGGQAAAIVKGVALTEALTSLVAFGVMVLLSGWAAQTFVKEPAAQPLIVFYGLIILSNLIFETSRGVLQTYGQFGRFSVINLAQTLLTFAIVLAAVLSSTASVRLVLAAYFAGKTLAGIAIIVLAARVLNERLPGWLRIPLRTYSGWRGLLGFALSTNLNGTVNLLVRDNIPLYIAALTGTAEVAYFKIAFGFTNLLMLPIEPFIWPTYTEITTTISRGQLESTRRLLRRVSVISAGWVLAAGGAVALLGWWLIPLLYGPEFAPAYPATLILMIGYGYANIFGWNRPLLLALGMASFPLVVAAVTGAVELALIFTAVPQYGYLAAAAILSRLSPGLDQHQRLARHRRAAPAGGFGWEQD